MADLRKISAIPMPNLKPAEISENTPEVRWLAPSDLFIEPEYQRNISGSSISLIRRIVAEWDWSRFKPPICAEEDGTLFVVDGQHTAIAAASHGKIDKIPVIIIKDLGFCQRAQAFIGHNKERLNITPMQMHYAALSAGDEVAIALDEGARKSGVKVLKYPPPHGIFNVGDLICIGTASDIAKKKGAPGLSRALNILVKAKRAPIAAVELKAVAVILWGDKIDAIEEYDLSTVIRSKGIREWEYEAMQLREASDRKMSIPQAMAELWLKEIK